jgi:hypothetical protein
VRDGNGIVGAGGNSVFGFSPEVFQSPKYFEMTATAFSGEIFPMTTIVVRSGRNARRNNFSRRQS